MLPTIKESKLKRKSNKKFKNTLLPISKFKMQKNRKKRLLNMFKHTKKSKQKRRDKLRLLSIEKFSCRFKDKKLNLRSSNLLRATRLLPKSIRNKLRQKKLSMLQKKEGMSMRLPGFRLHVIKKHVKLLKHHPNSNLNRSKPIL